MGDKSGIQWRAIPGFDDYQVSENGQVRRSTPGKSTRVGRLLRQQVTADGYPYLMIRRRKLRVHTAVLAAFVGPCPTGMECRHLDGDHSNNKFGNLVWGTRQQNVDDKIRHGRQPRGELSGTAKLTESDVLEIRSRIGSLSLRALGAD